MILEVSPMSTDSGKGSFGGPSNEPFEPDDELLAGGVTTLEDAVTDTIPLEGETPSAPPAEPAKPMTTAQILGALGMFSSFGLQPEEAASYRADLEGDMTLVFLLEMLGLADALASYGIGSGGGKMPDWLKVALGTGVLGFFLWQKRGKYGTGQPSAAAVGDGSTGNSGFSGNSSFPTTFDFNEKFQAPD